MEQKLKNQLKWSKKQTSYAWAQYFSEVNKNHEQTLHQYNITKEVVEVDNIPLHILSEYKDMMSKLKSQLECPICMELIDADKLKISMCGHKYCKSCYDKLDSCAICRKEFKK